MDAKTLRSLIEAYAEAVALAYWEEDQGWDYEKGILVKATAEKTWQAVDAAILEIYPETRDARSC